MILNDVHRGIRKNRKRKRIGRGTGSGHGKTSGRGHKGARSRAGYSSPAVFQGGTMPLVFRIPKRGFNNRWAQTVTIVNVGRSNDAFKSGDEVTPEALVEKNLAKGRYDVLKVLGEGEVTKKLKISAHRFSKSAMEKITGAGGEMIVLPPARSPLRNVRTNRLRSKGPLSQLSRPRRRPLLGRPAAVTSATWPVAQQGRVETHVGKDPRRLADSRAAAKDPADALNAGYLSGWLSGPPADRRQCRHPGIQEPGGRSGDMSDGRGAQRQPAERGDHLRPGDHALYLGIDHLPALGQRLSAARATAKGRRSGPQEDQRIHALRDRVDLPVSKLVLRQARISKAIDWSIRIFSTKRVTVISAGQLWRC